jgi:hypothetical protein
MKRHESFVGFALAKLVMVAALTAVLHPLNGQSKNGQPALKEKTTMFDTGFTERYSGSPVTVDASPVPIRPAAAVQPPPAPVVPGEGIRMFVNDRLNSRVGESLASATLALEHQAAIEPGFQPLYTVKAGQRILLQGIAAQLFSLDLTPLQKITGGYGQAVLYPAKNLAYAPDIRGGILGAFDLETGKKVYALSLLNGYGYSREWYTRRGNRIFVASLQAMVDPHESMPEFSTLEICQLNEPETTDDFGFLRSTEQANLIRKAQHLVAASPEGAIVVAFEDHVFLLDWNLKIRIDLLGEFHPVKVSLDEAGTIYLVVDEKDAAKRSALWLVRSNGERGMRLPLDRPASSLIAPPVIGYDHTIYLVARDVITAVSPVGEVMWARRSQGNFAGAVVTPDHRLLVSDGPELITLDPTGQRTTVFHASEPLVTPPLVIEGGKVLVASPRNLYLLGPGR